MGTDLVSIQHAAKMLDMHETHLIRLFRDRHVIGIYKDNLWYMELSEIQRILADRKVRYEELQKQAATVDE